MRKFVVYNDIHFGSLYALDFDIEEGAIYNGDIIDFTGCLKKDLKDLRKMQDHLEQYAGPRYNHGNHEASERSMTDYYVEEGVLFRHAVWSYTKALKWSTKKHGSSKFKRRLSLWFNKLRRFKQVTLSDDVLRRCWHYAVEENCDVVVLGHSHPTETVEGFWDQDGKVIRVLVLPAGRNVIEV